MSIFPFIYDKIIKNICTHDTWDISGAEKYVLINRKTTFVQMIDAFHPGIDTYGMKRVNYTILNIHLCNFFMLIA